MLDVVPSAVSKAIAALEADLAVSIWSIDRRKDCLLPTKGEKYYEQCRVLLQGLEEAEAIARGGRLTPRGLLRIGMHPALRFLVLNSLGSFLDTHPEVSVETSVTNSAAAVVNEGLDLVIRIGPLTD